MTATSVYLYYDAADILIYVGITNRGIRRNVEHNVDKDWWSCVARQEVEHHETREKALAREKALIYAHCPPFNKHHNPSHDQMLLAYQMFRTTHGGEQDVLGILRAMDKRLPLDVHHYGRMDHMAFRTRVSEAPIAALLRTPPGPDLPKAYGYPAKKGGASRIARMEMVGPLAVFHMTGRRIHPVSHVEAHVKYDTKQKAITVTSLQVTLDHSEPALCDHRCPRNRAPKIRWIQADGTEGAA